MTDYSRNDPKENAASLLCAVNLFSEMMQTYIKTVLHTVGSKWISGCLRTGSNYRSFRPFYPRFTPPEKLRRKSCPGPWSVPMVLNLPIFSQTHWGCPDNIKNVWNLGFSMGIIMTMLTSVHNSQWETSLYGDGSEWENFWNDKLRWRNGSWKCGNNTTACMTCIKEMCLQRI